MTQVKTQNKIVALVLTMAMAIAMSLALAPSAFAVDWNSNVTVTAMGGNAGYESNGVKTESGQYIAVTMQFASSADLSTLSAAELETYLQTNTTIAGRWLDGRTSGYERDIYGVSVDNSAKTVTFAIAYNTAGTTANYNGCLCIRQVSTTTYDPNNSNLVTAYGYPAFATLMGADVETLIGTGVAVSSSDGTLNADGSKTFTISSDALNRGMVHVLIVDAEGALFTNTGTFENGGLTVHAHTFITQTPADFASAICSSANSLVLAENANETVLGYEFEALSNGSFVVTDTDDDCSDVKVYIYDCNYLNANGCAVGEIMEEEIQNP